MPYVIEIDLIRRPYKEPLVRAMLCDALIDDGVLRYASHCGSKPIFIGTFDEALSCKDDGCVIANAVAECAIQELEDGETIGYDGWPVKACKPRPSERDRLKQAARLATHAYKTTKELEQEERDRKRFADLLISFWWR